jgi:hypothetical protein
VRVQPSPPTVAYPLEKSDGPARRSSTAFGQAVVVEALRAADPAAADAAAREPDWRKGYLRHFRALIEAGLTGPDRATATAGLTGPDRATATAGLTGPNRAIATAGLTGPDRATATAGLTGPDRATATAGLTGPDRATATAGLTGPDRAIAAAGLAAVHERMRFLTGDVETSLDEALEADPGRRPLETVTVAGTAQPERELTLPYRGEVLRGAKIDHRLDAWVANGVLEPSAAEAVREVARHPDWLDLSDQRLVVLGAGAEMGPLPALLGWGGTVVGVDLPRPELWARIRATAEASGGRLIAPVHGDVPGADLLSDLAAVAGWLRRLEGRLILGNYVYAPGAAYPRLSAAVDALSLHLRRHRDDVGLAFLATPTDVFAVPGEAVAQATARYHARSRRARVTAALSGHRLLRPNYPDGAEPGVNDSLVPQQGPNYALAKRIQRWRATVARPDGLVSLSVAPPTRTRSVTSNRLLAAAYAGAHLFDVEVFDPATANRLMAVLLIHQIRNPRPPAEKAWQDEAFGAVHGGLWRTAYHPRTALGLAAIRGLVS